MIIHLAKPVRIFHRPLKHVPQNNLPVVCHGSFISKPNITKEKNIILQPRKCKLKKFHKNIQDVST
jgi:hypothetical protein